MSATATAPRAKTVMHTSENWLACKIEVGQLIDLGFELHKDRTRCNTTPVNERSTQVTNVEQYEKVLWYAPLGLVMAYYNSTQLVHHSQVSWVMAFDDDMDHIWQGNLKTMADVLMVMCMLTQQGKIK